MGNTSIGLGHLGTVADTGLAALAWVMGRRPKGLVLVMESRVSPAVGSNPPAKTSRNFDIEYVANSEFLGDGRALQDWFYTDRIVQDANCGSDKAMSAG